MQSITLFTRYPPPSPARIMYNAAGPTKTNHHKSEGASAHRRSASCLSKANPIAFPGANGVDAIRTGRHRPIPTLVSCRLNDTTGAKKRFEAVQRSPDWAQFELYQGGIARGMLPHAMDDGDKYRLMARELR